MSRDEIARRVSEMLRQVGLEAMENKYPSQLSGGMQKRVALAHVDWRRRAEQALREQVDAERLEELRAEKVIN